MAYVGCTWSPDEQDACLMCTGEYCANHGTVHCECDTSQRHNDGLSPAAQSRSVDNDYIRLQRRVEHLEYCSPGCSPEHKDWMPSLHPPANCLICGVSQPSGHVMVYAPGGSFQWGRVCSSHTLRETILGGGDRWTLRIESDYPEPGGK